MLNKPSRISLRLTGFTPAKYVLELVEVEEP